MTDTVATPKTQAGTEAAGLSPADRLKQAVTGSAKPAPELVSADAIAPPASVPTLRFKLSNLIDARSAIPLAALGLGLVLGAGATALVAPREDGAAALALMTKELGTQRSETARLSADIGRLASAITEAGQRATGEAKAIRTEVTQRVARTEQALTTAMAAQAERRDAADKDQAARITALAASMEKKMASAVAPVPAPVPQAVKTVAAEPVQTGSIADAKASAETKPKTAQLANWAVREVYDGIAVLEDRKRRLVEVARGDMVPGVGRAESIERRGRSWVVVTRDGLITPQDW